MVCWATKDKPTLGKEASLTFGPSHPPGFNSNHGLSQGTKVIDFQLMPHEENSNTQHESQCDGDDESSSLDITMLRSQARRS